MARHASGVCSYFLQGNCRFGDRCWYEHPRYGRPNQAHYSQNSGSNRRGGWSGHNQRYSSFSKSSNWHDSRGQGSSSFSQNRFAVLDSSDNLGSRAVKEEEEELFEIIRKDMEIWESSRQWMFSTYSPIKEKPNISGFSDFSPEELRCEYYNCRANNDAQNYINSVQQLLAQWRTRLLELKNINSSTKATLMSEFKNLISQPPPTFGFGGQQASTFGATTFPVDKPTGTPAFSFKSPSEMPSVSSGITPAFGNAPSPAVSHSVGFGTSSPSSFSFKMGSDSGGPGVPGFSGFGKPFPLSSSNTTSASGFGTSAATSTLNIGNIPFAQPPSVFGGNTALASPATPANVVTSETLFTPKAKLSPEELKQFEAKRFTLGKIPLKPPPVELLSL